MLFAETEFLQIREYLPIHLINPLQLDKLKGTQWIPTKSLFEPEKLDILVLSLYNPYVFQNTPVSLRWDNTIFPEQLVIRNFFNNHHPLGIRTWDCSKGRSSLNKHNFKEAEATEETSDIRPDITITQNITVTFEPTFLLNKPLISGILEKCLNSLGHMRQYNGPDNFFARSKRVSTIKYFIFMKEPSLHGLTIINGDKRLHFSRIFPLSNTPDRHFFNTLKTSKNDQWLDLFEDEIQLLNN